MKLKVNCCFVYHITICDFNKGYANKFTQQRHSFSMFFFMEKNTFLNFHCIMFWVVIPLTGCG